MFILLMMMIHEILLYLPAVIIATPWQSLADLSTLVKCEHIWQIWQIFKFSKNSISFGNLANLANLANLQRKQVGRLSRRTGFGAEPVCLSKQSRPRSWTAQEAKFFQDRTMSKLSSWGFWKCGTFWACELLKWSYCCSKSGHVGRMRVASKNRVVLQKAPRSQFWLYSKIQLRGFFKYI